MRIFALSAVGADRPGIIAALAARLVAHGVNVTDSQMGILRGCFAMTLIVQVPPEVDADALRLSLEEEAAAMSLDGVSLREVTGAPSASSATHVISVYGADHPGIVSSVTAALAEARVNVCDLRTRLIENDAVYVMVIDVAAPDGLDGVLDDVAAGEGVDITLRAVDSDVL